MKSSVIIAIDGRAGAGQSSIAKELAKLLGERGSVTIISLKDLYPGWEGLAEGIERCAVNVIPPLQYGRTVRWLSWDWAAGDYGQQRITGPADFLILEGVGAGAAPLRALCDAVAWVDSSAAHRWSRVVRSGNKGIAANWKQWTAQEDTLYATDDVSLTASVVVSPPAGTIQSGAAAGHIRDALGELPMLRAALGSAGWSRGGGYMLVRRHHGKSDPESVFARLFGNSAYAVWLDASDGGTPEAGQRSRFSIMADDGGCRGRRAGHHNGLTEVVFGPGTAAPITARLRQPLFQWLDSVWGRAPSGSTTSPTGPRELECGFKLGWLGYLGYGLKRECGHDVTTFDSPIPDAQLIFAGRAVILDHETKEIWLLALSAPDARTWLDHAESVVLTAHPLPAILTSVTPSPVFQARDPADSYRAKVQSAKAEISEGNTYEVCLTTTLEATLAIAQGSSGSDPLSIYRRLRRQSPAPFAAFARLGPLSIASSSPERFIRIADNGAMRAEPIKGTRRRAPGIDREHDAQVRAELAANPKDRAENLMIVDLLRNDLSHFAVPGSVSVSRLFAVESYSTVHQLVSTVDARLLPEASPVRALAAAFPPGSMTGAPKISTMGILDRLEAGPRGVYSGVIGYFSRNGAVDLSVVIRTIVMHRVDDTLRLTIGVGGAIVADSTPEGEYEEIRAKAWALLDVLDTEFPE